jgi:phage-related protein
MFRIKLDVDFLGEPGAGLTPYTDSVTVEFAHGPTNRADANQWAAELHDFFREWYSGAKVVPAGFELYGPINERVVIKPERRPSCSVCNDEYEGCSRNYSGGWVGTPCPKQS